MTDQFQLDAQIIGDVADALIYSDRSGTIMRWNRAATALFGFSAAEALGQNLDLIIPEHLRAAHWKGFEAALASGAMKLAGKPTLTRALHKSGRKLYIEMTFALVRDSSGNVLGSVAMARDATERIERERAAKAPPQNFVMRNWRALVQSALRGRHVACRGVQ
ncbi:PAS domain S-box protein [Bradyrhizobium guangxiense]|uniref:PAS domain S-box protein n=1 Tax=Bradyrhizobium guangxiense TaxID=1325115 RepID=UPI001FE145DF|nr:PAS domain S-box protein [Bradyrhizobium guangxiense]